MGGKAVARSSAKIGDNASGFASPPVDSLLCEARLNDMKPARLKSQEQRLHAKARSREEEKKCILPFVASPLRVRPSCSSDRTSAKGSATLSESSKSPWHFLTGNKSGGGVNDWPGRSSILRKKFPNANTGKCVMRLSMPGFLEREGNGCSSRLIGVVSIETRQNAVCQCPVSKHQSVSLRLFDDRKKSIFET